LEEDILEGGGVLGVGREEEYLAAGAKVGFWTEIHFNFFIKS